ncbi:50S ribosomal protein L6 [Pontiella sulfatireligans]|uniref:Large ribosomal subunit protein uL6 n=1 Tax=Pontiella sulfatireligans TaxID=2750658 RepID=A0A6C2UM83_9BACT|nr:50S ribosomal protein L6 [Pontiella sulfatireligans]VGO20537.1 50S ribosomal protein L6 [Pontiella sulfatireligans]
MSRIGKQPILILDGVTVGVDGQTVSVKGSKGESSYTAPACIAVAIEDGSVVVSRTDESRFGKAMFGTVRSLIDNMIVGVSTGYKKELIIEGVGYKAVMKGQEIILSLGFSHEINYAIPDGIAVEVKDSTKVSVEGIDKQLVGQVAARIRDYSPAEPYKGKGVRYAGEQIRRKEGKAVA